MYAYIYSILSTLSPAFYHLIPSPISFSFSTDAIFTFISLCFDLWLIDLNQRHPCHYHCIEICWSLVGSTVYVQLKQ